MSSPQVSAELNSDALIKDLRSKAINDDARRRAAQQLRELVAVAQRDLSPEMFQGYWANVQAKISGLLQGDSTIDKLGGIYALDAFVDFEGVDATVKYTRFASALTRLMSGKDINCMQPAAIVIGKLCRPGGGSLVSSLVDTDVQLALEFLQDGSSEERRYSAALLLREIARNAPTLMYGKVTDILDWIWVGLRDQRHLIRVTSAEAVSACFKIISERDLEMKNQIMDKMYNEAGHGFKLNTVESIHGSMLVLKELLEQGGMFMQHRYTEACEIVSRYKDHRDAAIRKMSVLLIPDLAIYAPTQFSENHLHQFMIYLSAMLKREKERNDAFVAIGSVANAVKSAMAPYLDGILIYIREGLSVNSRKKASVDPVFDCISRLAVAVGQTLTKYMEALLDPVFACDMTPKLTQALVDIAFYVPAVRTTIQERLLNMISLVLSGEPYKHLGAPITQGTGVLSAPVTTAASKDASKDAAAIEQHKTEVKLALNTLGCFDFSGHVLNEFVRDVAMRYVEDDEADTREAASLTCCQLYLRDPIVNQDSYHAMQVVGDVVERLLTVGVSDPVPHIRYTVLNALDDRFDRHLGKADNIRTIFYALNDEYFPIREVAVRLIGRLTRENPAYIVPSLRKTLIQMLTELEFSDVPRNKEESAKLLSLLVQNAQMLIQPYVHPMMEVLLPKAADPTSSVAATIIKAIGEICTVGGEEMLRYKDRLMPILVDALQDQSSMMKREAALRTIGQLASNSGYVIDPYLDYPQLLDLLQNIIRGEPQHAMLRQETIKLMGILGALDPYRHQQVEERSPEVQRRVDSTQTTDISLMMTGLTPSNKEYFPTVVVNALLGILNDHSLVQYHQDVISAIMSIFRTLGLECVPFLDRIIPAFLQVIRSSSPSKAEAYFSQLATLVSIVRQHIRNYLPCLVEIMQEYWNSSPSLHSTILSLIESISRTLEGEFKIYLAGLLPLMLGLLEKDTSVRRLPSEKVLHAFLVFGSSSEEYMHLIVPVIVRTFEKPNQPTFLRKMAIETIGKISRQVNLNDFASKIIHPLNRVLASGESSLRVSALDTLCALIHQLGKDYLHFMNMVNKTIQHQGIQHANYELLVAKLQKGDVLPQDLTSETRFADQLDEVSFAEQPTKKLEMNAIHLRAAWETKGKSTKEDWQEWLRSFSTTLLNESPNHALRACAALGNVYPPLARELFNSAFVSCWSDLYENYQDELISSLENAFKSENIPPDLLGLLLNLAEFMEHDDKALPIDIRVLGREAGRCHAYAKALHYKELEFLQDQSSSSVEALISINNQLQQSDAAIGILRKAQLYSDGIQLRETWFEKLERWEEALEFYETRERELPENETTPIDIVMGKMRCLHALGQWDALATIAGSTWANSSQEVKRLISPLATAAAWGLNKWDLMDMYLQAMKRNSTDRAFFGAILALHRNQYREAAICVEQARQGLDVELSALVTESYTRAYQVIVRVQMLAELEELIVYKQCDAKKQESLRHTWDRRLLGCQRNAEVWQRMLRLRSLVVTPMENMQMWIKFANLCRKSSRMTMAETSLQHLIGNEDPLEYTIPYWVDADVVAERESKREREREREYHRRRAARESMAGNGLGDVENGRDRRDFRNGRLLYENSGYNSNNNELLLLGGSGGPNGMGGAMNASLHDDYPRAPPPPPAQVIYAVLKYQWDRGQLAKQKGSGISEKSLDCLRKFTSDLNYRLEGARQQYQLQNNVMNNTGPMTALNSVGSGANNAGSIANVGGGGQLNSESQRMLQEQTTLLAKCYLRTGDWTVALNRNTWRRTHVREVLSNYAHATQHNPKWYKAWHAWALANFEVVEFLTASSANANGSGATNGGPNGQVNGAQSSRNGSVSSSQNSRLNANGASDNAASGPVDYSRVLEHVVPAVHGFFQSIALSKGSTLQDTLRLLALWLTHGGHPEVNSAVTDGFALVNVDTWLEVIPQLIARINQPNKRVQQSVHNLLADVGRAHPQALVYPLTVAMKSWQNTRRSRSAAQIMDSMRQHSAKLVEQADLVSHELIRVAVLWHELWHEGLEEASRLYFGDHNIEGMLSVLQPLHDMLERGPETLREISFAQAFGRDLSEAREWCKQYEISHDVSDLNQAWDVYYQVFRRITRQLPQITSLELAYCCPKLVTARDLDLSVPGKYRSGQPVIRIMSFETTFTVISSKQRPRKLNINGSDGASHTFLLKGHEDIRQDERVMQLFGLCNTLLSMDSESYKRHLNIERYPAIPLSQNSGLLGWVPNSDTIHVLIREYRDCRKILLNIEHRIMLQMAPDYDNLTLLQKVEVFGYALDNTTGQDLYRVLWLKSKNSEAWLERRTNYTRSLGVMSMVGYILGLGDRHPSNLMLDRGTGKIIHIDFGDCFEVAMKREKYPERVPFRLTRMLTYAMEVSNIEGSFRITSVHVMRVLRANKDSVMAVLEAFIHDPLLTWRLTNAQSPAGPNFQSERELALVGPQAGGGGGRARRPSVLDSNMAPSELLAGGDVNSAQIGIVGGPPGARGRARTNSSLPPPTTNGTNPNGTNGDTNSANPNGASGLNAYGQMAAPDPVELQNARAVEVLDRVQQKLTGRDFKNEEELEVDMQVNKLIGEATRLENLCQHYIGWCSFW
ncbi:Atypical/PIKK/FRAP protein kinase [Sporothrix schenckii ATCC 58251]|uniref:Serine/threonine-protein kinase TOR n=1 Tax=Sporothrix schenckii (strain ATCC 58251 / de Perez 2211183) TaxID=1391915 RepID=U7PZ68_SPOS1|nr:Atypical/PIKK/FRAP protein kinase [Sporothrix schenckii ATCC 58251]